MSPRKEMLKRTLANVTNQYGKLEAYAWPGGYDIAYYAEDNGLLCAICANENRNADDPQWNIVTYDVTDMWDTPETCEHCTRSLGPEVKA